jgi:transcriptional regulator with XRE-family HTH domain
MSPATKIAKPEWGKRIEALRASRHWSQVELASRLSVSQVAVSRWEKGSREPGADIYVALGRLADGKDRWYWWQRAGFTPEDYRKGWEELERLSPRKEVRVEVQPARGALHEAGDRWKKQPDVVAIPLLKDAAAAGSPRMIEESEIEDTIFGWRRQCPHPDDMVAIKIEGDSMSPVLEQGYIVVVDTAAREPKTLVGRMVAARDPDGAVTIKWLRQVDGKLMLLPQHTSLRFQPIFLNPGWGIVGEVVWWIGQAP